VWTNFDGRGVVEHHGADPIFDENNPPCGKRGGFGGGYRFHAPLAAEEHRKALIDDQQDNSLAFLAEDAQLRFPRPVRGFPIDLPYIVPELIAAEFLKIQTAATEPRGMLARQ
jgi:hypothetical protein